MTKRFMDRVKPNNIANKIYYCSVTKYRCSQSGKILKPTLNISGEPLILKHYSMTTQVIT